MYYLSALWWPSLGDGALMTVALFFLQYRLGSETASMSSISSTDESFHWRPPALDAQFEEEESDADSRLSGSQLVDSCLWVWPPPHLITYASQSTLQDKFVETYSAI